MMMISRSCRRSPVLYFTLAANLAIFALGAGDPKDNVERFADEVIAKLS